MSSVFRLVVGLLSVLALFASGCHQEASEEGATPDSPGGKADIYGIDDRAERYEAAEGSDEWRLARASAILMDDDDLVETRDDEGALSGFALSPSVLPLRQAESVCEDERFADQPAPGFCSATLVAPDLVATSGHCLAFENATPDQARCDDVRVVFDFAYERVTDDPVAAVDPLAPEQVYSCVRVEALRWRRRPQNQDWALLRLDRPVSDREHLPVLAYRPAPGTPVLQIGHPSGIPQKLAPGVVTDERDFPYADSYLEDTFTYSSDLLSGNSGGGVFDLTQNALAGIPTLYSAWNYVRERGCYVPGVCGVNAVCDYPPGAFATSALLAQLAEDKPALLSELQLVGAADGGLGFDAGIFDAGIIVDGGLETDAGSDADAGFSPDAGLF